MFAVSFRVDLVTGDVTSGGVSLRKCPGKGGLPLTLAAFCRIFSASSSRPLAISQTNDSGINLYTVKHHAYKFVNNIFDYRLLSFIRLLLFF